MDTPLYDSASIEDKWGYLDVVQVWLLERLTPTQLHIVEQQCTPLHASNRLMQYQPKYRQRLQLYQPTDDALLLLDRFTKGRYLINALEFSLDLIVGDDREAAKLQAYLETHLVKQHHGKQRVSHSGTVSYWGKRWSRNQPVVYCDRPSKVTGQLHCVHVEWRTKRADPCRAIGIGRLTDLIGFNHQEFWKKWMQLWAIDYSKLGRVYRKTRRRAPWYKEWVPGHPFDMDRKIGLMIAHASQRTGPDGQPVRPLGCVQEIKDFCPFDIRRALVKLPVEGFLPL